MGKLSDASEADRHIGARIRLRRELLGLSQTELGEASGVSFAQIHKYEMGANRVSPKRLLLIAEKLGVPPSYFLEDLPADAVGDAVPEHRAVLGLLRTADGVSLAIAWGRIDASARRSILALVEAVALTAPET